MMHNVHTSDDIPEIPKKFTETFSVERDWQDETVYSFTIPRHGYIAEITIKGFALPFAVTMYIQGEKVWSSEKVYESPFTIPYHVNILEIPYPRSCELYIDGYSYSETPTIHVSYDIQKEHHIAYFTKTFGYISYTKFKEANKDKQELIEFDFIPSTITRPTTYRKVKLGQGNQKYI